MDNQTYHNHFKKYGYVKISNVLSQETCALIKNYLHSITKGNENIYKNSDALKGAHRGYGDPFCDSMLVSLQQRIEAAIKLSLWPTFSFYYLYYQGAQLTRHKDRESCEVAVSLNLSMDTHEQEKWPIYFNSEGQTRSVGLAEGDLVVFRGSKIEHWRDVYDGNIHTQLLLAYVEKSGPYHFMKNDGRKRLGTPHVGMLRWFLRLYGMKFKNYVHNTIFRLILRSSA